MPRMLKFTYHDKERTALELGIDERLIGCLSCYQVEPKEGTRSFKVAKMMDVREVPMDPRAAAYVQKD